MVRSSIEEPGPTPKSPNSQTSAYFTVTKQNKLETSAKIDPQIHHQLGFLCADLPNI